MGVLAEEGMGTLDLISADKVTPFLYAHHKLDEGAGDIITDSSGNGHHMTWNPAAANDADTAGVWNAAGLSWPATPVNLECFLASSPLEFPFDRTAYSSIYVYRLQLTGALTELVTIFSKRGGVTDTTHGGYQHYISNTNDKCAITVHGGSDGLFGAANAATLTGLPDNEIFTVMEAYDSTTNTINTIQCSDTTAVQWETAVGAVLTGSPDSDNLASKAAYGARGSLLTSSDRSHNLDIFNAKFYHDTSGGALPNNLGDICRWLHHNPDANIPAEWWS